MVVKYVLVAGISASAGYYVASKRLEQRFREDLARETEEAKDFYRRKYIKQAEKEGEDSDLTEAAVDAAEALLNYSGISVGPSVLTQEMTESVARAVEQGELDPETPAEVALKAAVEEVEELKTLTDPIVREHLLKSPTTPPEAVQYNKISTPAKTEEKPKAYVPDVITIEDFIKNETGYKQFSVTYYAGDDILAGESDQVVELETRNVTMGEEIVERLKAGRPAMDGNDVLYIRNDKEQVELEIARNAGNYSDLTESG